MHLPHQGDGGVSCLGKQVPLSGRDRGGRAVPVCWPQLPTDLLQRLHRVPLQSKLAAARTQPGLILLCGSALGLGGQ